jgi:hypothetical protein
VRRTREHKWFWPYAALLGLRWSVDALDRRPGKAAGWAIGVVGLFGLVVIKLRIDALVVFWALIIVAVLIVAKGARMKWLHDSGLVLRDGEPGHPVHVAHGGTYIENYHAAPGEPSPVARQSPGITIRDANADREPKQRQAPELPESPAP